MTKVQMIVTESGEVINFDNVISIGISEELKRGHETTEFVLYAHTVNNDFKTIRKFDDKETARTCLMSELMRAKQTDGIARFDSDITAILHETQSAKEHKSKWVVRKPMTEGGEYEVQCEKCGHTVGLLVGAKSYEEALERFKEWLEHDDEITFTKHCSSCGARMEGRQMKGYKAFEKDLTCRGFQFEIGKEYEHKGKIEPCESGFHFCESLADCYSFYPMSEDTRICEISATGDIKTDDNIKFVTNKIKIVREIKNPREKSNKNKTSTGYCNTGNRNTGDGNTGDYNTGNCNTGYYNTGDYNTGYYNTGDRNTGYYNTGDRNTGDYNTGDRNTGYYNTGDRNTGDYNTGDYNTGYYNTGDYNTGNRNTGYYNTGDYNTGNRNTGVFCTNENPKINMFDAPSDWTMQDWLRSDEREILSRLPYTHTTFVWSGDMSEEEKENHPEYKTIGGYLKTIIATTDNKQAWWDNLTDAEKNMIKALPNFDEVKFCKCIGIERI